MVSAISTAASATPMYLHLMVFVILILATALFLGGTAAVLTYRNRLLAAASRSSTRSVSSRADLEKGNTNTADPSGAPCDPNTNIDANTKPRTRLIDRFLRWRRRVLYESDPLPELALLPSYQPKEPLWRKVLGFLLRKRRVIPDPPTIVTITRVIEAAEARERAAAAAMDVVVAKADEPAPPPLPAHVHGRGHGHGRGRLPASPPPSFRIPAIVVQCWDTPASSRAELALALGNVNPFLPPSCSAASSFASSSSSSSSSASASTSSSYRTPSSSSPSSASSSSSSSSPSAAGTSGLALRLSPAAASPATFFFPGLPSLARVSSLDRLHVPPPSWGSGSGSGWGGHMAIAEQVQVLAGMSDASGARFVLGPAPPPRAVLKSKGKELGLGTVAGLGMGLGLGLGAGAGVMYAPPLPGACMAFAAATAVKQVEGERKVKRARNARAADGRVPWAPQEGVVGIVAGGVPEGDPPRAAASGGSDSSESDDLKRRGASASEEPARQRARRAPGRHSGQPRADLESEGPPCLGGLLSSSSTTSSLVDLILEAIAAETDESFHYTTVSTSFSASSESSSSSSSSSCSSSSRSSASSTASSRSGASWASDEDEDEGGGIGAKTATDRDGPRSFLMLEDESEEDFMDAVLSAYIRTDDEESDTEVYSSNMSSGSNYGEFDDIELDPAPCKAAAAANVKGSLLPPHGKKFLSVVRVVHPGFAI